jgi:hypothetical protein
MKYDCHKEIQKMLGLGVINEFSADYLKNICEEGLDDALWEEAVDDMLLASSLGVDSEADFRLFFYIDHFSEDLVEEIFGVRLSEDEEDSLKHYMFKLKGELDYSDLVSFRVAILRWLQSHGKIAKEAVRGTHTRPVGSGPYYLKRYNIEVWAHLVQMVNKAVAFGINKKSAIREAAGQIQDPIEKLDFLAWYNFKFGSGRSLYDINKEIQKGSEEVTVKKKSRKTAGIYEDALSYYVPKEVFRGGQDKETTQYAEDVRELEVFDAARQQQADEEKAFLKEDMELAKSKMLSRTFALDKLLQRHQNTLGSDQIEVIEDALNSLRKQIRKLKLASLMNDCIIRTAGVIEKQGFQEGGEILRKLAEPERHHRINSHESRGDLNQLLDKLTDISTFLKQRAIVRDLAEADLLLYGLNMASLFPELTEAQAKLIEAFSYAGNKLNDIIPKIRGSAENLSSNDHHDRDDDKEEDIPLSFPEDSKLRALDKSKREDSAHKEQDLDRQPEQPKKKKEVPDMDLNLEEVLPTPRKESKEPREPKAPTPPKEPKATEPTPPAKSKALLNLEKALED